MPNTIKILWDGPIPASVTIRGAGTAASTAFTVGGSPVTFPYTLSADTKFDTVANGTYSVSVVLYGWEIAGTPDARRTVELTGSTTASIKPSLDPLAYPPGLGTGEWGPAWHGLIAWAYDPVAAATVSIPTSGLLQMVRIKVPFATTITNILLSVGVAGATLTAGQCFAGLYDANRVLLSLTANRATAWASAAIDTAALVTPQAVVAGDYFVGFWWKGTTGPSFTSQADSAGLVNVNLATASARFATSTSGLTTTAPNPAAALTKGGPSYWVAVS